MTGRVERVTHPDHATAGTRDDGAVAARAVRGALALGGRQVAVHGTNAVGAVLLARCLAPAELGVVAIVAFLASALVALAGGGLAASLVRAPSAPTVEEEDAVATAQLVVAILAALTVAAAAPYAAAAYGRPAAETWLFAVLAFVVPVAVLQLVPTARLERRLAFGRVAAAEIAQALAFQGVAVGLAWRGAGAASVGPALVLRAVIGSVLVARAARWRPRVRLDLARVRPHLRFGLAWQGAVLASVVKDAIVPGFIGLAVGATAVGYVTVAQTVATAPAWVLLVLQRVYLPAFARLQHDRAALAALVARAIVAANAVVAPCAVVTLVLVEPVVGLLFGVAWLPVVPMLVLLWCANLVVPTITPLLGLLNALGRADATLRFGLLWMAGTWLLGVPLVLAYGDVGYGLANLALLPVNLLVLRRARAATGARLPAATVGVWTWAGVVGVVLFAAARMWPPATVAALASLATAALVGYGAGLALVVHRGGLRSLVAP